MDPDMALGSIMGQDLTVVSGGYPGYSYQAVPQYPSISRSTSLHVHTLFFPFSSVRLAYLGGALHSTHAGRGPLGVL